MTTADPAERARALYREGVELFRRGEQERSRRRNEDALAIELHNLGHVELRRGDTETARELFAEARALRAGSEEPYDAAMDRLNEAALAADGDPARAIALLDEAQATLAGAGIALDPDDRFEADDLRARLNEG